VACSQADNGIEQVTSIPDDAIMVPTNTPPVVSNINNNSSAEDSSGNSAGVAMNPTATPEPLDNNLGSGEARVIAQATDQAYQPTPRNELVFDDYPVEITFNEFYDGFNMRTGLVLSDKLVTLDGDRVVMEGYVAPPLKPKLDFFVLTSIPLASCPFCSTAADWPDDVALIYLTEEEIVYTPYPVRVSGRMEIGSSVDAESGMVSLVRIYADELEVLD
jgi:hypothetical protein